MVDTDGTATPVHWRWLLVPAILHVLLHLVTTGHYGMFRDEYYYLACAQRLDWGYVDHPPLSILVLAVWTAIFGDSLLSIRILPALAGGGLVVAAGMIAAEMGGRRFAQTLAAVSMAIGAVALAVTGFYSMNAFDFLFWAGAFLLLVRIVRTGKPVLWIWLGLLLGVGLQNKIGLLVLGSSLALALLATRQRSWLARRHLWIGGALAIVIFLPYVVWNLAHDWPTPEFIDNAKQNKIVALEPLAFFGELVLEANPINLPIWIGGLGWLLFGRRGRSYRMLGLVFVFTVVTLFLQKSKPYYAGSAFSLLFAAGGCAWEGWTESRRLRWLRVALPAVMLAGFVVLAPLVVPILPIGSFLRYQQTLGLVPQTGETIVPDQAPQYYSDRFGWENQVETVARVWATLAPEEREEAVVLAGNYGEAGALEYLSRRYDLPPVVSGHNNYALWHEGIEPGDVALAIGFRRETLERAYEIVEAGAETSPVYAREGPRTVWICRKRKIPAEEILRMIRFYI